MFDNQDFQQYLNGPVEYWSDFGKRCALAIRERGISLSKEQLERTISNTLTRITKDTGATIGLEQATAFSNSMREAYNESIEQGE